MSYTAGWRKSQPGSEPEVTFITEYPSKARGWMAEQLAWMAMDLPTGDTNGDELLEHAKTLVGMTLDFDWSATVGEYAYFIKRNIMALDRSKVG